MEVPFQQGFSVDLSSDVILWRYMDLEKFLLLLQTRALYFPHYSKLGDPWEGAPRLRNIREGFSVFIGDAIEVIGQNLNAIEGSPEYLELIKRIQEIIPDDARPLPHAGISCWHMSQRESAAMWDIYAGHRRGIAIRTTVGKLFASLSPDPKTRLLFGAVKYVDYDDMDERADDKLDYLFLKWHHYHYEEEFRVIALQDSDQTEEAKTFSGYSVPVDLGQLFDQVLIAPGQPPRILEMIERLLDQFGLDPRRLSKSAMDETPEEWIDRHTHR